MSYVEDLEFEVGELKDIIRGRNRTMAELREELNKTDMKLDTAEYRISSELEPRLKSEQRSYDSWVTSGGSNICMSNGMKGNCGVKCSAYGDKSECTDDLTDEELLNDYRENDVIEQVVLDRGLWVKKIKIDWKEDTAAVRHTVKARWDKYISNIKERLECK